MGNFQVIGAVSSTLRAVLLDRMDSAELGGLSVTVGPPRFSAQDNTPQVEPAQVNLFLYRAVENAYVQNQEIPGHGSRGAYGHPPLSLNLHYLLTAYGNLEPPQGGFDGTLAHEVLGSAMRVFHDIPVITDKLLRQSVPTGEPILDERLLDDVEHIKITLEPLTLEDITKIWTALALRLRLSVGYVVNVVRIESRRARRFPRPVGRPASAPLPPPLGSPPGPGPDIQVFLIQTPTITDLRVRRIGEPAEMPFAYARVGDTLILRGTSLAGPVTHVRLGDLMVPATMTSGERVEVTLPDATIPGVGVIPVDQRLQPGVRTARVVVRDPRAMQGSFTSNAAPFMLVPAIGSVTPAAPRRITLIGTRLLGTSPGGETVIGRAVVAAASYVNPTPTTLVVPLPDSLPARDVRALVGDVLLSSLVLSTPQELTLTIGATATPVSADLPSPIASEGLAPIVENLVHDAGHTFDSFLRARVEQVDGRLVILPGGLTDPVSATVVGTSNLAAALGLTGSSHPGAGSVYLSGALVEPPQFTAVNPRVRLQIGGLPAVVLAVPRAQSLAALAAGLQAAIRTNPGPAHQGAMVGVSRGQLLVIPGVAGTVAFTAVAGDPTTVAELQLRADFAVRVRVHGAESIDPVSVELPQ